MTTQLAAKRQPALPPILAGNASADMHKRVGDFVFRSRKRDVLGKACLLGYALKGAAMTFSVRAVEYFYTRVEDEPGRAYDLLAKLASEDINLLAFSAVPFGPNHVELTIFPDRSEDFRRVAEKLGWTLIGPQHACLIQGDDHLGALAEIHRRLRDARVNIYASTGVTDGEGHYGYVIYVKEEDHQAAARALAP